MTSQLKVRFGLTGGRRETGRRLTAWYSPAGVGVTVVTGVDKIAACPVRVHVKEMLGGLKPVASHWRVLSLPRTSTEDRTDREGGTGGGGGEVRDGEMEKQREERRKRDGEDMGSERHI